jgi:hypothetical protein
MIKKMMMIRRIRYCLNITFLFNFCLCSNSIIKAKVDIDWIEVYKTGNKEIYFCQIDSLANTNEFIFTYSHSFASGGGFKVLRISIDSDSSNSQTLLGADKHGCITSVSVKNANIGYILHVLDGKELTTKLICSSNYGLNWNEILTPLSSARKICFLEDKELIVEGNFKGVGQVFRLFKPDSTWNQINEINKNFKSFFILNYSGDKILGLGSTYYGYDRNDLINFNMINRTSEKLLDIGLVSNYFKPISLDNNLHGVINGSRITIFSYDNSKVTRINRFYFPSDLNTVNNFYIDSNYYLLSGISKKKNVKLSWISYDRGENWYPYNQNKGYSLVFNTSGKLFVTDFENNLLRGTTNK